MFAQCRRPWPHRIGIVVIAMLLSLAGCTSEDGPTVSQAGQDLKSHVLDLLEERKVKGIAITDPGGRDVACGDGRFKRTFAASARDSYPNQDPQMVKDGLVAALNRVAPYRIVSDGFDNKPIEFENVESQTSLYLDVSGDGLIGIRGETRCLTSS